MPTAFSKFTGCCRKNGCLLLAAVFFIACQKSEPKKPVEKPIARVHDKYLYRSALRGLVNEGTSPEDSLVAVKNFIENWIKHHLILKTAQENLPEQIDEIEQQALDYKESLLIYAYEQQWVARNLDTIVALEEIEKYYTERQSDFILQEPIYKLLYAVADPKSYNFDSLKIWFRYPDRYVERLDNYCASYCIDYLSDSARWYGEKELADMLPDTVLRNTKFYDGAYTTFRDRDIAYFLKITDVMYKGSYTPLSYIENDIRKIILNRRKLEMLKQTYKDLYIEGGKRNFYEVY